MMARSCMHRRDGIGHGWAGYALELLLGLCSVVEERHKGIEKPVRKDDEVDAGQATGKTPSRGENADQAPNGLR
jgi:hypothetical protein